MSRSQVFTLIRRHRQMIALWGCVVIVVVLLIYPPWCRISRYPNGEIASKEPYPHSFIWSPANKHELVYEPRDLLAEVVPPQRTTKRVIGTATDIDVLRLCLEILPVIIIGGALVFTLRERRTAND